MNNLPSWTIRVGGILGILSAAMQIIPENAPGAAFIKPYAPFVASLAAGLIGFTARQNNISSEAAGAVKPPPDSNTSK